jgi:hypothetical protein
MVNRKVRRIILKSKTGTLSSKELEKISQTKRHEPEVVTVTRHTATSSDAFT